MASEKSKVAVVGATGETGLSIINALLEDEDYIVTGFARPKSIDKPRLQGVKAKGVSILPLDIEAPVDEIAKVLQGQDIIISCIIPFVPDSEKNLVDAAKRVEVKRFIPSFFAPVSPPTGVSVLRESKEVVLNYVKKLHLPYTVIDVGAWYQSMLPSLTSGKLNYLNKLMTNVYYEDGQYATSLTDLRDVGKYVALILKDPRTLNKYVFAYNEVWSQEKIFKVLEDISGEKVERQLISREAALATTQEAKEAFSREPSGRTRVGLIVSQYAEMIWFRGDSLPETAEYLGYLSSKDLYPDFAPTDFRNFIKDAVEGKAKSVYEDKTWDF